MIPFDALQAIDTRLRDKMLARLAMRWPHAATYTPDGTTRVLCAHPLPEAEQAQLDTYTLAYQDAIQDILNMLDKSGNRPEPPLSLRLAENSVFQGGTLPERIGRQRGHWLNEPAKSRGVRRDPEARRRLENPFKDTEGDKS